MKIEKNENKIIVKEIKNCEFEKFPRSEFSWNKSKKQLEAEISIFPLQILEKIADLPKDIKKVKENLEKTQFLINYARREKEPKPYVPAPVRAKLYEHQIRAFNMAIQAYRGGGRGFGLLFEIGCGKSLAAIAIAGALYRAGGINSVLVCCPSSITSVWKNEFQKFADFPFVLEILDGRKTKKLKKIAEMAQPSRALRIIVINYESTHRDGILSALKNFAADMIICDESQRIKNPAAEQSKALHALGDGAKFNLILSGTPVTNSAIDIFSQYKFLNRSVFGTNFYAFRNYFAQMGGYLDRQIVAYRHLDELKKKAHSIALRVTKKECLDLPEQVFSTREIPLEAGARRLYDDLAKKAVAEIEEESTITATTVLTQILRLQQLTGGFITDDDGTQKQVSTAKLDALEDIIDDALDAGEKVVVFARFTAELKHILAMLDRKKIGRAYIAGDVPMEQRGAIVDDFQKNEKTRVFVAQTATAGLGITLTAASVSVFYSVSYNYADYEQATGRTHRIGQANKCTYINLTAKNTIDEKVLRALEAKEDLAKTIVDNWKKILQ